ncbi:hypothetical protein GZH47_33390 (plasmid) [Paenibacillus rhizovicinus]|uniref:Uncharacterized protein n=1 Tax=Paenibacillus rhizovicinus TaxID=2704463 RepID=A0A6C0PBH1_9BACL|nr:hypothetical protein [Paenibacillus rhizovicinus]QHW35789.1 hypothetical protein GZH47_33390 [Paenibacillus rhizovicinus]
MESLTFQVHMDFICELARTQFWDDGRDMDKVLELLYSIMEGCPEEKKYPLAIEILEGRKIIVGVNEGEVVEDGKLIRPIGLMIKKKQAKIDRFELERHMDVAPIWYIDSFMGGNGLYNHINAPLTDGSRSSVVWARERVGFSLETKLPPHPLGWGTYLLTDERFAFEVLGGPVRGHAEALHKMTMFWHEKLKEWKAAGVTPETMSEYQRIVYDRQWLASGRKWGDEEIVYTHPYLDDIQRERTVNTEKAKEFVKVSDEYVSKEDYDRVVENWNIPTRNEEFKFHGQPDANGEFYSPFAWVSPEGVWYSCGFAGHQIKAEKIVRERSDIEELYIAYEKSMGKDFTDDMMRFRYEQGLPKDFLDSIGWVMLRDEFNTGTIRPGYGHSLNELQRAAVMAMVRYRKLDHNPLTSADIDWDTIDDAIGEDA